VVRPALDVYDAWAKLLAYPREVGPDEAEGCIERIAGVAPEAVADLRPLRDFLHEHEASELEELFTRTFDSNAERALEVGWHLYGENYSRGAFMVRMRQLLRECGCVESSELPDHLSHVLPVLARAPEPTADALANGVVVPALAKVAGGFKDEQNPYAGVIRALRAFLEQHHASEGAARAVQSEREGHDDQ